MFWQLYEWLFERERLGGARRSSDWPRFRRKQIKDECELCGEKGALLSPLELHHIRPFALFPALECSPQNVATGCRKCHLKFYHLGSFRSYNPQIKADIEQWQNKRKNRP